MPAKYDADHISILARKWTDGTITEAEKAAFEQWYSSFEDSAPEILPDETPEALRERLYDSILERNASGDRCAREQNLQEKTASRKLYRYLAGAACLAFLAFFSFWWMQNRFHASPFSRITVVHAGMQAKKVILPDGTIIWLKPEATLRYGASFGEKRGVFLTGEGLFEVAKDSLHAFTVSVGDYTATVLGTSFYIKQSDNRRDMELAVLTGKVKVHRKDGAASFGTQVILPDEKLLTGDTPALKPLTKAESKNYVSGTGYDMNFRDTPFGTVVARIERKFDVDIRGDLNRYASCRFTADLTDQGLDYTLELLAWSVGITCSRENEMVFFEGGGCSKTIHK